MIDDGCISLESASEYLGVSPQWLRTVARNQKRDASYTWRGCRLDFRPNTGRGGKSGHSYLVRVSSLGEGAEIAFEALSKPVQLSPPAGDTKEARHARWWTAHVTPALAEPRYSRARGIAITQLYGKSIVGPDGDFFIPSKRDVQRKIAMLGQHGGAAKFIRKTRNDKGIKVVELSQQWDRLTAELPEETRAALVIASDRYVRSLWRSGAIYSVVRRLSAERLADLTREAGIDQPEADLVRLCTMTKPYIEARRDNRRVHEAETDAKAFSDGQLRVRLTSPEILMTLVYGDVHHFNILLYRPDGTIATPKGIAWLDAANRRVRIDLVLCEPGTAIRNEDLILSFVKMTQDPFWGLPKRLYLDNGSEYQFADLLEAALKLANLGCEVADRNSPVIRAQPHNAAAKGILEGTFRIINQKCIQPMKGSIHDDRMRKKSASLGKATVPHGTFEAFAHLFEGSLLYFNQDPQKGGLKGLSPLQKLAEQIEAGWKPVTIEESTAWLLFSEPSTAMVTKGGISVKGIRYHHDDLFRFNGRRLPIQVPKYLVWRAIPVFTPEGVPLCIAEEDVAFDRQDPAGAIESARRKAANRATIAAMAAETDKIDVPAEMARSAKRQPPLALPAKGDGRQVIEAAGEPGRSLKRAAPERDERVNQRDQDAQRKRLAILKKLGS